MVLDVSKNTLSGSIPSEIGALTKLSESAMSPTRVILNPGTVSRHLLARYHPTASFQVNHNKLIGSLPSEVGLIIDLGQFPSQAPSSFNACPFSHPSLLQDG